MCGIVGFNWQDENLVKNLGKLILHRGPDQEGFYLDNDISLGHQRLAILDLSAKGRQPMASGDANVVISFNGEIFNFQDIKNDLKEKGYQFISQTDTEVLLYAYQEYGYKMLSYLNGQFAFVIYDKIKQKLFLARDRVGINPLYYYFKNDKFIFGSELKVILESGIAKDINQDTLNYYLMYGHTPRKQSIIDNCFKLEPGHFLVFNLKEKKIEKRERYWDFKFDEKIKDKKEAAGLVLAQLEKSVQDRLLSDVPVGAFLSGGVDSSAVVAMASRHIKNLNTFSVKFDQADFDESGYAKLVADKFKTNHHVVNFNASDVRSLIPELVYHYDEPFADPSMIPTTLVSKVASKYVKVSLSGDGGDEIFGGYGSYNVYRWISWQKYYPRFINNIFYLLCSRLKIVKLAKLTKFFAIGRLVPNLKFAAFRSFLYPADFAKLIKGNKEQYYAQYSDTYHQANYLNEAMNIDIANYLPDNILTKVDRASLGNSLESRPPLLDHDMLELASKISPSLKIKNGENKYIFKKALEGILPREIIYRKKKGFAVPLRHYLKDELRDLVDKYVINYDKHNLYKPDLIIEIKKSLDSKADTRDYSRLIWTILIFNLWYDKWILNNKYGK